MAPPGINPTLARPAVQPFAGSPPPTKQRPGLVTQSAADNLTADLTPSVNQPNDNPWNVDLDDSTYWFEIYTGRAPRARFNPAWWRAQIVLLIVAATMVGSASRAKPIRARAVGRHSVEIGGPGVYAAITELEIPRQRPRFAHDTSWLIPQSRAEELFAYIEHSAGRRIEVTL